MPEKFLSQGDLPSSWDWRTQGMVTRVKDQGDCDAWYAFAAIANIESKLLIDGADAYDFSENNAKECNWYDASCRGGNYDIIADLFSKKGTVLESCDPYVPKDTLCESACPYQKTLLDWRIISGNPVPDTEVLQAYIHNYGPVYATMYAGYDDDWHEEFSNYDGSYTLYYPGAEEPNHAVLIVGWDDSLTHAGEDMGGWIVKNSWGTDWGGTCGYGTEKGYFTIAYGSASIGMYSSFMYDWQDYDTNGDVMYYDEGGNSNAFGCGSTTAWGLAKFFPPSDTKVTRVEFWTIDATTDVDVYIYDDFDGSAPSNLLAQKLNNSFDEAGYHSVALDSPLAVTSGDDIIAVVKFTNDSFTFPLVADAYGPDETGRTYISCDGSSGSWTDLGAYAADDVAIRLRTSNPNVGIDKAVIATDFQPGDRITFTLAIANTGGTIACGVVVTDMLPAQVLPPSFVASSLTVTRRLPSRYVWDVEPLDVGRTGVITITGLISPGLPSDFVIVNRATIWDPEDSTPANNTDVVIVNGYVVYLPLVMKN